MSLVGGALLARQPRIKSWGASCSAAACPSAADRSGDAAAVLIYRPPFSPGPTCSVEWDGEPVTLAKA